MTFRTTRRLLERTTRTGLRMAACRCSGCGLREVLPSPPPLGDLPEGEVVDLPGRGRTFVVDVPGPSPEAPTLVLLHGLGCTAYLGWAHAIDELSQHVPGGHLRPALARPRDQVHQVPHRRLRRRRRSGDGRARHRARTGGGLLHGRRGRPADLAPAPGARHRAAAVLHGLHLARPPGREALLPGDERGDAPALGLHPRPGRAARRASAGVPRPRRQRPDAVGEGRVPQHQPVVTAGGARPRWAGSTLWRGCPRSTCRRRWWSPSGTAPSRPSGS